jgi:hypothetical protein
LVEAGAVVVVHGSATGITPTGPMNLIQGQAGLLDTSEIGDGLEAPVAA